jgi:membrane protein DedA with SNARE-associated domain
MTFADLTGVLQIITMLLAVAFGGVLGFFLGFLHGRVSERRTIRRWLQQQQVEQAQAKLALADHVTEWSRTLQRTREALKAVMRPADAD